MEGTHRHDGGVLRIDVARDDGLQRRHDGRPGHDRVSGTVGHGAVAAHTFQRDRHIVGRRHHGPLPKREPALCDARHVVHREDRVARKALEQPLLDHQPRTARVLFGGLEDQVQRAGEAARFGQMPGGCQQHRGVPVMAAGMHHAIMGACPGLAGGFLQRQGVHVGAQAQAPRTVATAQGADDTGRSQAAMDLITPGLQAVGDAL